MKKYSQFINLVLYCIMPFLQKFCVNIFFAFIIFVITQQTFVLSPFHNLRWYEVEQIVLFACLRNSVAVVVYFSIRFYRYK